MVTRKLLAFLGMLLLGALYFSACQNNVNTTLEDSIAPYLELQAIGEAQNATMVVNPGATHGLNSYFAFEIRNVKSNGLVHEGLTEGWCLEWNKPMSQNNDVHTGIEMYNTFGSSTWKPANYLMNIKNELHINDPELTYREIQVALWSLIEEPRFDLDQVLKNGEMPTRLMRNGQPNFNVEKVKEIVNRVRSEVSEFEYTPATSVIVFSNTGPDEQNGGTRTCGGETAWSDGDDFNTNGNGNWALYTSYEGNDKTVDLLAGSGRGNNGSGQTKIGTVTFSPENGKVRIKIDLNDAGAFQNKNENVKIQGYNTPPSGNPQIGQFEYKSDASGDSFEIVVDEYSYYAVHVDALACETL